MILTRNLVVALIATVIAFSTLYIPQPMLPLLADQFGVSPGQAGLLMTLAMLPLAVAPVLYGYFLQVIPARLMLKVALSLLALNQVCFFFADQFWHLLIGGFIGRLVGGVFASSFDWHSAFLVMGLMQLVPLFLLMRVEADADINFARLDSRSISRVLGKRNYRFMFLSLASIFFVFSGILNIVPFHLRDIAPGSSPLVISMLYLGYLVGAPMSFFSENISRRLGDARRGLLLGLVIHGVGLVMLLFVALQGLIFTMFFLAAGFFLIHALLSGLVNHLAQEHKGVVNGLYVSIYYFSGALGSWLPGYLYEGIGWQGMVIVFVLILGFAGWSIGQLESRFDAPEP